MLTMEVGTKPRYKASATETTIVGIATSQIHQPKSMNSCNPGLEIPGDGQYTTCMPCQSLLPSPISPVEDDEPPT